MTIEEMIRFVTNATPLEAFPSESRPQIIAALKAGQELATHVEGLLDLGAVATPANTKHWLEQYKAATGGGE